MTSTVMLIPLPESSYPPHIFDTVARGFAISTLLALLALVEAFLWKCGLNSHLFRKQDFEEDNTDDQGDMEPEFGWLLYEYWCVERGSAAFMRAYLIPHHQAGLSFKFDLHMYKGFLGCNAIAPRSYGSFV